MQTVNSADKSSHTSLKKKELETFLVNYKMTYLTQSHSLSVFSLCLKRIKASNFTARRVTWDGGAVTSIPERQPCDFSILQLFFMCRGRNFCGSKI